MGKIISLLGYTFIIIEVIVIVITYFHSIHRYKYVMESVNKKSGSNKILQVVKKPRQSSDIIKFNMTEKIDRNKFTKARYPVLRFYLNDKFIRSITLYESRTFIGRSKSDDIEIEEQSISRSQCFITNEDDNYYINIDLLRNPVFLNNKRMECEKKKLSNNDIISMGNKKISFEFIISENNNNTSPLKQVL